MRNVSRTIVVILTAMVVLTGCTESDDPTGSGMSAVRVVLTDAATDYLSVAEVRINSVLLVPGEDDGTDAADAPPFLELLDPAEAPMTFNLLDLQNGVTAFLAEKAVPEGSSG